jgi:hypothetical protein
MSRDPRYCRPSNQADQPPSRTPDPDGEYLAGLGFDIVGFDISETNIRLAEHRAPGSSVHYLTADLLDPPRTGCEPTTSWPR